MVPFHRWTQAGLFSGESLSWVSLGVMAWHTCFTPGETSRVYTFQVDSVSLSNPISEGEPGPHSGTDSILRMKAPDRPWSGVGPRGSAPVEALYRPVGETTPLSTMPSRRFTPLSMMPSMSTMTVQ